MSKLYHSRPSELLGISGDAYTAYCFDEAMAYITSRIKDGEKPKFPVKEKGNIEKPHYSSMSSLYKSMGYSQGNYTKTIE